MIKAVSRGLERAKNEFNARPEIRSGEEPPFDFGLIVCAMRFFDYGASEYFDSLLNVHRHSERKWIFSLASQELVKAAVEARDQHGIPVVGFDLAGMEKGYPAVDHKAAYALAHKNFLKKTVHAGEAYGPESIFQAITDLYADRIGHGVHLFNAGMIKDPEIGTSRGISTGWSSSSGPADHRRGLPDLEHADPAGAQEHQDHSFGKMTKAKLSVTFCTDNRTVSSTTVSDEIPKPLKPSLSAQGAQRHRHLRVQEASFRVATWKTGVCPSGHQLLQPHRSGFRNQRFESLNRGPAMSIVALPEA